MDFGETASVWNFNRTADALQQLLRGLLLAAIGHYVDDFINGIDDERDLGNFSRRQLPGAFCRPRLMTKASKAQPPAAEHIVQAVTLHIESSREDSHADPPCSGGEQPHA